MAIQSLYTAVYMFFLYIRLVRTGPRDSCNIPACYHWPSVNFTNTLPAHILSVRYIAKNVFNSRYKRHAAVKVPQNSIAQ